MFPAQSRTRICVRILMALSITSFVCASMFGAYTLLRFLLIDFNAFCVADTLDFSHGKEAALSFLFFPLFHLLFV